MKSKDLYNFITNELKNVFSLEEADNIARLLLEAYYGVVHGDLISDIDFNKDERIEVAISRLKKNEPIQYILGKAHFYGRDFKVNSNVLIPRRETEELVYHIIRDHPNFSGTVLDIGTGSGCIPITLSLELSGAQVEAIDISKEAIQIAAENSKLLDAKTEFHFLDVLNDQPLPKTYDIIVSNPPYVMHKEKELMQQNVLDHEPHLALFVNDDNPLVYYEAITKKTFDALMPKGALYFEINEQFGNEVAQLMADNGFVEIKIIQDMQGKDRIVKGIKKSL